MRIVSHSCSNTEIICALGCADYLVGVDDHSDYPETVVSKLPKVGADLDVDPDKVTALKPDLVIASDTVPGHDGVIENLKKIGVPIITIAPRRLSDISHNIQSIADAIGVSKSGRQLAQQFRDQLNQYTVNHVRRRPKVLVEWWPKPVIVPGRYSWVTELIQLAGGVNPWADENCQSRGISTEEAQQVNPDFIVMSWCGVKQKNYRSEIVKRREGWQNINAIKHDNIFPISEAYLGRPGPRLITGLQKITAALSTDNHSETC